MLVNIDHQMAEMQVVKIWAGPNGPLPHFQKIKDVADNSPPDCSMGMLAQPQFAHVFTQPVAKLLFPLVIHTGDDAQAGGVSQVIKSFIESDAFVPRLRSEERRVGKECGSKCRSGW